MPQVKGSITYNGKGFDQFQAMHTAAYVDQNDLHQAELTVRETLDFAARCQGIGHKAGELALCKASLLLLQLLYGLMTKSGLLGWFCMFHITDSAS